ncbi:MAG: hypothetical protein IPN47_19715 [Gemmatimonadetes bacterium]|nr:hypothetical protein [Gemmatimonadota bacterium]
MVELHREQLDRHENYKKNGRLGGRPPKSRGDNATRNGKPGFPDEEAELKPGFSNGEAQPKPGGTEVELLEGKVPAAAGARIRVREGPEDPDDAPDVLARFAEPHRAVVARFLDAAPVGRRDAIAKTLDGWLLGQGYAGGRAARQEDIATRLADYLTQESVRITFLPKGFRSFVEDAERRRTKGAGDEGARRRAPVTAERAARATELHRIVIREHLGSLNGIQFEQQIASLQEAGTLDETTVAEIRALAPLSDIAKARSEDDGRRIAIDRLAKHAPRPQLSVIA